VFERRCRLAEAGNAAGGCERVRRGLLVRGTPARADGGLDRGPFYLYNGADQLGLYGERYFALAGAGFVFGFVCLAVDLYQRRRGGSSWKAFELPLELYAVTFCAIALIPENLHPSPEGAWIGLLAHG